MNDDTPQETLQLLRDIVGGCEALARDLRVLLDLPADCKADVDGRALADMEYLARGVLWPLEIFMQCFTVNLPATLGLESAAAEGGEVGAVAALMLAGRKNGKTA